MSIAMLLAFAILLGALVIFILDIYPIDFVAFGIMALILLLGPILNVKPEEAISGFSNPATITILAMFILSAGVYRTGMINLLAHHMVRIAGDSEIRQLLMVLLVVGPISAFINNTAAVAILIPSVLTLAREHKRSPSKLLIPLSYFSQMAGAVTLIGTATNILASSLAQRAGYGTFGMFEFTHIGLMIFITGSLYLIFIGRKMLPNRVSVDEVSETYAIKEYLTEVIILKNSSLIGKTVVDSRLREQFDIHVLEIVRGGEKLSHPLADKCFDQGDILFIKTNTKQLLRLKDRGELAIESETRWSDQLSNENNLKRAKRGVLEAVIGPNCDLIGGTLETTNFRHHYNCTVIAIRKHGELIRERLSQVVLNFGDTLLLRGAQPALEQIKRESGFIVTEEMQMEEFRREKIPIALAIISGVAVTAALGYPILVIAIVGSVLMVLTGCLKANELHEAIRWDVIFLLAGIIPLGLALQNTGGAQFLADVATLSANHAPPIIVLGIFYVMTAIMAEFVSHSAAVVVMVPVGIATAETLGLDVRAFILASMFASSMSFSTPVSYQTNTMVYGPGGYKFIDFTRVGAPLSLLLAIVTPIYISLMWGL
ncbi:MAG: SLC13 family permease [Anaerolineae bacterium]|nr:SLC13 family permease [Anaerolineae bacterium]